MTIAEEIWAAVCGLHRDHPNQPDFSVEEIREAVFKEFQDRRPGVQIHIASHCVANKLANPADHRLLFGPSRGRRRLFRDGDAFHRSRASGMTAPSEDALGAEHKDLLDWYRGVYCTDT